MATTDSKTSSGDSVLKALQAAVKGLTYTSEADKPVKAFLWPQEGADKNAAVNAEALHTAGKTPEGATVKTLKPEEFFEPVSTDADGYSDDDKALTKRFRDLDATLQEQLTNLTYFRIEKDDSTPVDAYVVGRTADGDLAGVSTQLIET